VNAGADIILRVTFMLVQLSGYRWLSPNAPVCPSTPGALPKIAPLSSGGEVMSLEDTLCIFTLSVVVVMAPKVPRPEVGSLGLSAVQIAEAVNSHFVAGDPDLFVDPVYLAHALPQYKAMLEGKLSWVFHRIRGQSAFTPAMGGLLERQFAFLVTFPALDVTNLGPGEAGWEHDTLRDLVPVRCERLLSWRFPKTTPQPCAPCLSLAYSPSAVKAMMLSVGAQREGSISSRCSTAESESTTVSDTSDCSLSISVGEEASNDYQSPVFPPPHKLPRQGGTPAKFPSLTPAKTVVENPPSLMEKAQVLQSVLPRDAIMQLQVAPAGRSGSTTYNSELRKGNIHASHYAAGKMPSAPHRFQAVTSSMPDLYEAIFDQSVSIQHVKLSRANAHKVQAQNAEGAPEAALQLETECNRYNDHAARVRTNTVEMCELIAGAQAGGSVQPPARVENGVLMQLCGTSKTGQGLFCAKGLCCSWPTAKLVIQGLLSAKVTEMRDTLAACKGRNDRCDLVEIDNYVALMWPKHLVADRPFTVQCATVQVIVTIVDKDDPNAGLGIHVRSPRSRCHGPGVN
jgi:hypothetical protein